MTVRAIVVALLILIAVWFAVSVALWAAGVENPVRVG